MHTQHAYNLGDFSMGGLQLCFPVELGSWPCKTLSYLKEKESPNLIVSPPSSSFDPHWTKQKSLR